MILFLNYCDKEACMITQLEWFIAEQMVWASHRQKAKAVYCLIVFMNGNLESRKNMNLEWDF